MKTTRKLAIHLEHGQITFCLWRRAFGRWTISAKEGFPAQPNTLADQVLAAARGLVIRWKLAPDTPVIVQAPAGTGGILSMALPAGAKGGLAPLIEAELTKALPFPLREIHYAWEAGKGAAATQASIFWVPRAWVADLSAALSRIGLRLAEVVMRASLAAHALKPAGDTAWALLEADKEQVHLHSFRGALPVWASSQTGQQVNLALESLLLAGTPAAALDLYFTSGEVPASLAAIGSGIRSQQREPVDYPDTLLQWYQAGNAGILIDPERSVLLARLTPVAIALLLLGFAATAAIWWLTETTHKDKLELESSLDSIRPAAEAVIAQEKRLLANRQAIAALERLYAEPDALDALDAVARALPKKAWLVRFSYHDGLLEAEGYGSSNEAMEDKLKNAKPGFTGVGRCQAQLASQAKLKPFCVAAGLKGASK